MWWRRVVTAAVVVVVVVVAELRVEAKGGMETSPLIVHRLPSLSREVNSTSYYRAPARLVDVCVSSIKRRLIMDGTDVVHKLGGIALTSQAVNTDLGQFTVQVAMSRTSVRNLKYIRRVQAVTKDEEKNEVSGSLMLDKISILGNYEAKNFPLGPVPKDRAKGRAALLDSRVKINFTILVDDKGMPLSVSSWDVNIQRLGRSRDSGLGNSKFGIQYRTVIRNTFRSLEEDFLVRYLQRYFKKECVDKL